MTQPTIRQVLETIAKQGEDKTYDQMTKSDMFEALKYARHVAKMGLGMLDTSDGK